MKKPLIICLKYKRKTMSIKVNEIYNEEYLDEHIPCKDKRHDGNYHVKGQYFMMYKFAEDWYYSFMYVGKDQWKCIYLTM